MEGLGEKILTTLIKIWCMQNDLNLEELRIEEGSLEQGGEDKD